MINAGYAKTQFWDGRAADLGGASDWADAESTSSGKWECLMAKRCFLIVREDDSYQPYLISCFFWRYPQQIALTHVAKAIASFERTFDEAGNSLLTVIISLRS